VDQFSGGGSIERGRVEISRKSDKGRFVLGEIGPNEIFGEMSLIDDAPRMATATAIKETVCYIIPRQIFEEKMGAADPFLRALLRIFVSSIRSISPPRQEEDFLQTSKGEAIGKKDEEYIE